MAEAVTDPLPASGTFNPVNFSAVLDNLLSNGSRDLSNFPKKEATTFPRFLKSSIRFGISWIKSFKPPNPCAIAIPDCILVRVFSKFAPAFPDKAIAALKAE